MTHYIVKKNDAYLTVKNEAWAWGLEEHAIKFADNLSAVKVLAIVEAEHPSWNNACSVKEH